MKVGCAHSLLVTSIFVKTMPERVREVLPYSTYSTASMWADTVYKLWAQPKFGITGKFTEIRKQNGFCKESFIS